MQICRYANKVTINKLASSKVGCKISRF